MMKQEKIIIFDTTLRDGEQAPGCSMNLTEKLAVAKQLEKLGVDVIEAGFPIASPGDFEAVSRIAEVVEKASVCGLARCTKKDIDACIAALKKAKHPRVHVFIATSDIHMQHKLKMSKQEVKEAALKAISYAKQFVDDVEFSCEDASRSDVGFLQEIVTLAIEAGAKTINLPDTVGYALPDEYGKFIEEVIQGVDNADKAIFSVHCHNDLGVAVANSLKAIQSGARQVEVSLNGIGERAGNAALEELVMAIYTKGENLGLKTTIQLSEIYKSCRLVSQITGMPIPANKAIVGRNAFLHESGIHQDGVLKERSTYEIMDPTLIGIKQDNLVLGKHSGRHAFSKKLEELGYMLSKEDVNSTFERFKVLCDKKKEILDEDIIALVYRLDLEKEGRFRFHHLHSFSGTNLTSTATIGLFVDDQLKEVAALAEGPIDSVFVAIDQLLDEKIDEKRELLEYRIDAITSGRDAQAEVHVTIKCKEHIFNGTGLSTSVLEASAKAYINAANKAIHMLNI